MKIAIALEATLGGTRKHVVDLIEYLLVQGHEVYFIYSLQRADGKFRQDLKRLETSRVHCVELPMTKNIYHPANLVCVWKMATLFRRHRIEVLHLHGAVAGAIGRMAAKGCKHLRKIVYSPHGGVLHKADESLSGRVYVFIEKLLKTKKVWFLAVSSDEKEKLQAALNLPSFKVALVPNGIDVQALKLHTFSDADLKKERDKLRLAQNDFILLYPALFLEAKGHLHFFKTFVDNNLSLSPNVKILLAGHGPLQPAVEALVNKLACRDQIIFLGFVNDIAKYFQLAKAVLLPSVNEAFGYVLLEAMAFSKVIFATNVGGIRDIVEHNKTGFLYNLNDIASMIKDINYFSHHFEALEKLSLHSTKIIETKFNAKNTLAQIEQCYNR